MAYIQNHVRIPSLILGFALSAGNPRPLNFLGRPLGCEVLLVRSSPSPRDWAVFTVRYHDAGIGIRGVGYYSMGIWHIGAFPGCSNLA